MVRFFILLFLFFSPDKLFASEKAVHPRGVIAQNELAVIRNRLEKEPYKTWYSRMIADTRMAERKHDISDPYRNTFLALKQAQLYLLSGEKHWAEKCYLTLQHVLYDTVYFNDPVSRGLTRATQLSGVAQCYDFCYQAWSPDQRMLVNTKLFSVMMSVNANMGFSANYALESNWNGVRWGSALLAALVYDEPHDSNKKNRALPFIWDITKRLKDHIEKNVFPGGWSGESLSYHGYNWSFIGPALAALQNSSNNPAFATENFAPHVLNALWGWSTSTVSISTPGGRGIQPDLSDDDPQTGYSLLAIGLRLYPAGQIPYLKWMHDNLLDVERISDDRGNLFYSVCWYPEKPESINPEMAGWTAFTDSSYGISVWRNRFQDENDVVVAFTAPVKRISGHKGPDNLGFRIIGAGNIWVTGGGRTGEIAGQSTLFASVPEKRDKTPSGITACESFCSGVREHVYLAKGCGSCMGVTGHCRSVEVDFSRKGCTVIYVSDSSENGRIWRLNTPGFNQVTLLEDGFLITAPNGSEMKVSAPPEQIKGEITITEVNYGGSTTEHNQGIGFGDLNWPVNKAVDIPCDKNIEVTLELKDKLYPSGNGKKATN